ncbi:MAG TPA: transposase [Chthoniobacterales bacterium]|jgi:REP element-mobilizing transposase RayT
MARSVRIEFPGAIYHVMARGNRREHIFLDQEDRERFVQTLGEVCAMTGWRVHAWVLLGNHYHLMIETPEPNLVAGMKWLQNTITRRFNVRHRAWGRVFGDRYKAVIVEGSERFYYETLMDYIHLNPMRAGLVRPDKGQSILDYPWSSIAKGYGLPASKRVKWLAVEDGVSVFGFSDTAAGRRRMVKRLDRRAMDEGYKRCGLVALPEQVDARCSHLRRGWYWGSQSFAEKMQKLAETTLKRARSRAYRGAAVRQAHGMERAQRWLEQGLAAAGLRQEELPRLRGSDPRKVNLAQLLWRRTTVTQEWLADKLQMRSAANVSQLLRRAALKRGNQQPPGRLADFVNRALRETD